MKKMSTYPIGALWKATNSEGSYCKIWLESVEKTFERWRWSFQYFDGSSGTSDGDWEKSYRMCYNECIPNLIISGKKLPRFKRIK